MLVEIRRPTHSSAALGPIEYQCWIIIGTVSAALGALAITLGVFYFQVKKPVHDISADFASCPLTYDVSWSATYDGLPWALCPALTDAQIEAAVNDPCKVSQCAVSELSAFWAEQCKHVFAGTFIQTCIEKKEFSDGDTMNDRITMCERENVIRKGECAILYDDSSPLFDAQTSWDTLGFLRGIGSDRQRYRCGYEAFGQLITNNCKRQGCRFMRSTNNNALATASNKAECFTVECPTALPAIENAAPASSAPGHCSVTEHGNECPGVCADGYTPTASATYRCGIDSTWVGNLLCMPAPCAQGNMVPNAKTQCIGTNGDTCDYECQPGYERDPQDEHMCGADGTFRGGRCTAVPCTAGILVANARDACSGTTNEICPYICNRGHMRMGVHVCHADGEFRGGGCLTVPCSTEPVYPVSVSASSSLPITVAASAANGVFSPSDYWSSEVGDVDGAWLEYDYPDGLKACSYALTWTESPTSGPRSWKMQAYEDSSASWIDLHFGSDSILPERMETRTYAISSDSWGSYTKYRLQILGTYAIRGSRVTLSELEVFPVSEYTITFAGDFAAVAGAIPAFEARFRAALAPELGLQNTGRIVVTRVVAASIAVYFYISPSDDAGVMSAASAYESLSLSRRNSTALTQRFSEQQLTLVDIDSGDMLLNPCAGADTGPVPNGFTDCNQTQASGTRCSVDCEIGYVSVQAYSDLLCWDGSWSPNRVADACIENVCPAAAITVQNGSHGCTSELSHLQSCAITCADGFSHASDGLMRCFDGQLTVDECAPSPCVVSSPVNSAHNCSLTMPSDTQCVLTCNKGFHTSVQRRPTEQISCSYGVTTGTAECVLNPSACDTDAFVTANGIASCDPFIEDAESCPITCNDGYRANGLLLCTSGVLNSPTCEEMPCSVSSLVVVDGSTDCSSEVVSGESCSLSCNDGFTASGDGSLGCTRGEIETESCDAVLCPLHSASAVVGSCTCDTGYTGTLVWSSSTGLWVGSCDPLPCEPSTHSVEHTFGDGQTRSVSPVARIESAATETVECEAQHTGYRGTLTLACSLGELTISEAACQSHDPCAAAEDDCMDVHAICEHVSPGQHSCACVAGYYGDGTGVSGCVSCPGNASTHGVSIAAVVSDCTCDVGFVVATRPALSASATVVEWSSSTGVEASGTALSPSSAGLQWGEAGAVGTSEIGPAGPVYGVEFCCDDAADAVFGLGASNTRTHWDDIDYYVYCHSGTGYFSDPSNGPEEVSFGTYSSSDVFQLVVLEEAAGVRVRFLRNGVALGTSAVAPTLPLFVDVAMASASDRGGFFNISYLVEQPDWVGDPSGTRAVARTDQGCLRTNSSGSG